VPRREIRVCRRLHSTELLEAWRAGAPVVKLFLPRGRSGYIRDVLAPCRSSGSCLGGVSLENAGDWIRAVPPR